MALRSRVPDAAGCSREAHRGYSRSVVTTVLGLIGIAVFIVCVIALAAAVTWTVVRLTPSHKKQQPESG
jgi:Mn2+/Fe2+ NRAMP family transporter